jgi:hypothetical protein
MFHEIIIASEEKEDVSGGHRRALRELAAFSADYAKANGGIISNGRSER